MPSYLILEVFLFTIQMHIISREQIVAEILKRYYVFLFLSLFYVFNVFYHVKRVLKI